jgi:GNAT superfamily N-acetyltransferase
MDGLIIRVSSKHERLLIQQMIQQAWETSYAHIYSPEEILRAFSGELNQYASWASRRLCRLTRLVAVSHQQIVGAVALSLLTEEHAGEITSFYVEPAFQGCGVGTALWQAAVSELRTVGCEQLWVWSLAKAPACQFYEHRGCVQRESGIYRIGKHAEVALGYWLAVNQ